MRYAALCNQQLRGAEMTTSALSFFSLFSSVSEPVFLVDREGIILEANNAFCSMFSTSESECRGKNYFGLLLPDEAAQRLAVMQEVLRSRKSLTWDAECDARLFRYSVYPSQSPQGEINQLLIIAKDITDIGQLVINEKLFSKSVIDAIPGSFYVIDAQGKFSAWNRYVRDQVFGKLEGEIAEITGIECVHPDDRAMMAEKMERIMKNGEELVTETRVLLQGGPQFKIFLMTGSRMIIDGKPYLLGVGTDITERKMAEDDVRRQLQHIRSLREIDFTMRGTTDVYLSLKTILELTRSELQIDAADFFLMDSLMHTMNYKVGSGFRGQINERTELKIVP